jgi:uncharacterized protein YndB with AHSA1/START domain
MKAFNVIWQSIALAAACLSLSSARAEVVAAQPTGFEVQEHAHLAASPDQVWQALGQIGSWWLKDHTYSGDAHNLAIGLNAGDCFCERWSGGTVRHMVVVMALPGRMLRLEGALGPLGGLGVAGHLSFQLKPAGTGTDLAVTYDVGGWTKDGLGSLAAPVDGVLAAQVNSLSRYVDTK